MADLAHTDTAQPRRPSLRVALSRDGFRALAFAGIAALVAGFAAAGGGYFPTAWGWSALALLWVAALALMLAPAIELTRLELGTLAGWTALAAWTWLSSAWSKDVNQSVLEGERLLVFVAGVGALVLVARRISAATVGGGVLTGIAAVSAYSLATRLFPDRLGSFDSIAGYRLAAPIGYWNSLGLLAVLGSLLALGVVADSRSRALRAAAAASLAVLVPTMYFTFSRGSWIALGIGLVAGAALHPRRGRLAAALVAAAPAPALGVWLASSSEALTRQNTSVAAAARDGHLLALELVLLAAGAAALVLLLGALERRERAARAVHAAAAATCLAIVAVAVAAALAHYGNPASAARRAYDSFTAPPPNTGVDLNKRLFTFSSNGRLDLWRAAWQGARAHPVLGSGAGSYEQSWLQHRKVPLKVRDAHSLYLETLAELGPVGLALLLGALLTPLVAAVRARRRPLVALAAGGYVAYLVHAGVDWHWEASAVTLTALLVGASIVVAARPEDEELRPMSPRLRYGLLAGTLALAAVAFVGLVGNMALAESGKAARAGDWAKSESQARRAATWAPWSPEPWRLVGEAQLARGELAQARASFRKAIGKDERDWSLWLDLARASEGKAQLAALAQATRLNPLSPEIAQLRTELAELGTIQVGG